jgi:hypothetical protein
MRPHYQPRRPTHDHDQDEDERGQAHGTPDDGQTVKLAQGR